MATSVIFALAPFPLPHYPREVNSACNRPMGGILSRVAGYDVPSADGPLSVDFGTLDVPVSINLVGEKAKTPVFGSDLAAGSDLYASEDIDLPPGVPTKIETGVRIALPAYLYGVIAGRSSYNAKGILTASGIIDCDYRGTIKVLMTNNTSDDRMAVKAGERIAQLIIMPVIRPRYILTDEALPETRRGEGGFGSTGNGQLVPEAEPIDPVPTPEAKAPTPESEAVDKV